MLQVVGALLVVEVVFDPDTALETRGNHGHERRLEHAPHGRIETDGGVREQAPNLFETGTDVGQLQEEASEIVGVRDIHRHAEEIDAPGVDRLSRTEDHLTIELRIPTDHRVHLAEILASELGERSEQLFVVADEVGQRRDPRAAFLDVDRQQRSRGGEVLLEEVVTLRDVLGDPGTVRLRIVDETTDVRFVLGVAVELVQPSVPDDERVDRQGETDRHHLRVAQIGDDVGDDGHRHELRLAERHPTRSHRGDRSLQEELRVAGDGHDRNQVVPIARVEGGLRSIRFRSLGIEQNADVIPSRDGMRRALLDEGPNALHVGSDQILGAAERFEAHRGQRAVGAGDDRVLDEGSHLTGTVILFLADHDGFQQSHSGENRGATGDEIRFGASRRSRIGRGVALFEDQADAESLRIEDVRFVVRSGDTMERTGREGFLEDLLDPSAVRIARFGQMAGSVESAAQCCKQVELCGAFGLCRSGTLSGSAARVFHFVRENHVAVVVITHVFLL